jgi:hypothetical protein
MATKRQSGAKPSPTFEVRFVGRDLLPEKIPLRAVSEALSAVQDIASGRDPYEEQHVQPEKGIGLLDVRRGSAVFSCVARCPEEAVTNLRRVGALMAAPDERNDGDGLIVALRPIRYLSEIAKSVQCRVEVTLGARAKQPLFSIGEDDYGRIAGRLLMRGETTIVATIERVGGATDVKCALRVPGRRHLLYCDVKTRDLAQRLGRHLYEEIAAAGTATWIHSSWRIYSFTINDFTQPRLGNALEAIEEIRRAGLSAWDSIEDPQKYIEDLRT